jgi:hypothetical protein
LLLSLFAPAFYQAINAARVLTKVIARGRHLFHSEHKHCPLVKRQRHTVAASCRLA